MLVVVNSSPFIVLSGIGALDLLKSLFVTVHIPEAVYQEVVTAGLGRAGSNDVAAATWINRHLITNVTAVNHLVATTKLRQGESETLILAQELKADLAVIDERPARNYAQKQGLPLIGTLGILLLAKSSGLIPQVKPLLDQLIKFGMRLDKTLYQDVLNRAVE